MEKFDFSFIDIVEHAKDIIIVTKAIPLDDPGPEIVYVNRSFTELTGYQPHEVIGKTPRILQSKETDYESKQLIKEALINQVPIRTTIKNYSKHGVGYWLDISILPLKDDDGKVTHFVAIERDVTKQKELERKLEELTRTDPLTDLLNRRAFDEMLKSEFSRFKRSQSKYTLLMLDIDHFKNINDTYGHDIGDTVLKAVAKTCKSNLREQDSIFRIGGEEFCIVLPNTTIDVTGQVAEKLRESIMHNSVKIEGGIISVTVSMGIGEVNSLDKDAYTALKKADDKLYIAKESGRNQVSV